MPRPSRKQDTLKPSVNLRNILDSNLPAYKEFTGSSVTFAVLDTGVARHPYLSKVFRVNCTGETTGWDKDGHGTHVTGTLAAKGDVFSGLCPDANVVSIKVLGNSGKGDVSNIIKGLQTCLENDIDIIVMSLGTRKFFPEMQNVIKKCYDKGQFLFAAAGNFEDGDMATEDILFPARLPETICVGAVDQYHRVTDFSAKGRALDFVAPGVNMWSTWLGGGFAQLSGTSQATPIVAGIAGILLDRHRKKESKTPIRNQEDMLTHLQFLAKDIGVVGKDLHSGHGVLYPDSANWGKFSAVD